MKKLLYLAAAVSVFLAGCGTVSGADVAKSAQDAQIIALEHAGLTPEQVTGLHTQPDLNERVPHYDVDFHHNGCEYDYEIHAQTGEILKSEQDWD